MIRDAKVLRNLFHFFTPFIMATAFCFYKTILAGIGIQKTEGWSLIELGIYLPAMLTLASFDFIFRVLFKRKILLFWGAEIVLLSIGIWYMNFSY